MGAGKRRGEELGELTIRVQHHWSSAYIGFGVNNLDKDAQEMEDLVNQLQATGTSAVPSSRYEILEGSWRSGQQGSHVLRQGSGGVTAAATEQTTLDPKAA